MSTLKRKLPLETTLRMQQVNAKITKKMSDLLFSDPILLENDAPG